MPNYTAYHIHDDTSNCNGYADSCTKFDEYIKLAKKCDMKAISFSNHGGIYDWIKKKQYCDKNKIKYIHGVELYVCINLEDNTRGFHIGLYSKNWDGVQELNTLMSKATSKGVKEDKSDRHMYYNPRISFEELMNTSDNIIITTACLASPLRRLGDESVKFDKMGNPIENGDEIYNYNIQKREELLEWLSLNKHRCFLEIQYHKCEAQIEFNKELYKWSKEYNIPLIAGTDTHSSNKFKAECRTILQIAKESYYGQEDEFDLIWKTYDELVECFKVQDSIPMSEVLIAIENTNVLADMVEDFTLDKSFKYPNLYGKDSKQLWKNRIFKMLKYKKDNNIIDSTRFEEYKKATLEEFKVMSKLGMESFMMFMSELMEWCRDNNINSSPCRGSVGGSVIAYITDIIDVDPIRWKTVFSRFCNEDRISLGDIDEDFAPKDRAKVYKYIIDRFGNKNVSYILTLGTIQDRGSIDVLAKGLKYNDLDLVKDIKNEFDSIFEKYSKIIQEEVNLEELENATSSSPNFDDYSLYINVIRSKNKIQDIKELKLSWDKLREDNKNLFYYFDGIKGTIVSKGSHPSGMIGSPVTLFNNIGVFYKNGDEDFPVSFCGMKSVDSLNYVKFDILGLKAIGIIQDTYSLLNKKWERAYEIDWNDDNVWNDMLTSNSGIFQFEGDYAFDLLSQFKPKAINDMSLVNASLRPSGKSYRDRLIGGEFNKNPSDIIDKLLEDNKGFLVFQEDTIAFLQEVCGFSGSLADTTRRAIGKKDLELLKEQLPKILEGYCSKSNQPREIAEKEVKEFIQIISDSSEYQFGLNHSTGYSMNGYMCARLRYYYPLEFTTSYLNNAENQDDIDNGMSLAKSKKINIENPKFGYSLGEYFCNKETNTIYKGIGSIKGLGVKDGTQLYELSQENKYNNFIEIVKDIKTKTSVNDGKLKVLIELNFFKDFGEVKYLLDILDIYNNFNSIKQIKKDKISTLNLTKELVLKYTTKETPKQYSQVDNEGLINCLISKLENINTPLKLIIKAEVDYLGYPDTKLDTLQEDLYYVLKIDEYKNKKSNTYYPTLYNIKTGEEIKYKVNDYMIYMDYPFIIGDVIKIEKEHKQNKKKLDKETGKWNTLQDEFNNHLDEWTIY